MADRRDATVLVVSDDPELGGLIALNLRQRGLRVEHTDLVLSVTHRWAPSAGRLHVLVVNLETPSLASPTRLRQLMERPWARGVPLILAAADPSRLSRVLAQRPALSVPGPSDMGAIVRAVDEILDAALTG